MISIDKIRFICRCCGKELSYMTYIDKDECPHCRDVKYAKQSIILDTDENLVLEMLDNIHNRPQFKDRTSISNANLYRNMKHIMNSKDVKNIMLRIHIKYPGLILEFPSGQSVRMINWRKNK